MSDLNNCGCCEAGADDPVIENRPGLPALAYRIGTHANFFNRMVAQLSKAAIPYGDHEGSRPLADLTTRSTEDPAIALLDAWATVADVLTFYQERIANEGYLRTATERRSVLEMARAIGYELKPGVSAGCYLAFTVEDAVGAPGQGTILKGTQVQSIPAQMGELPQTFETSEEFVAQAEWNRLRPRLIYPQLLTSTDTPLYLQGTTTNLKPGDLLLIVIGTGAQTTATPRRIATIDLYPDRGWTRVGFFTGGPPPTFDASVGAENGILETRIVFNASNVQSKIIDKAWTEENLQLFLTMNAWNADDLITAVENHLNAPVSSGDEGVFALRQKVGFFGHNGPYYKSLPESLRTVTGTRSLTARALDTGGFSDASQAPAPEPEIEIDIPSPAYPHDWDAGPGLEIWKDSLTNSDYSDDTDTDVYLERNVSEIIEDGWVVFESGGNSIVYRVAAVREGSVVGFGMSAKATGLYLESVAGVLLTDNSTDKPASFSFRKTIADVQSEQLALSGLPIEEDVAVNADNSLMLNNMVLGLQKGQAVILTGERSDAPGVIQSEVLLLEEINHSGGYTTLYFTAGLEHIYLRDTVRLNANVVHATHGESVKELLGSGNGSLIHQTFKLNKTPLTYVSAATASGTESSLAIRVDNILWDEAPSFYPLVATDENFIARMDDDGTVRLKFGDAIKGARLPTGQNNVVATYRAGIGVAGEVGAGSLSLLKTRPFGIKAVTNPFAPTGAEDPEVLEDARENAPSTVLTLDRIVSLQDYEDFTRAFSGIGKVQAVDLSRGETKRVHLTITDPNGDAVNATDALSLNLSDAIEQVRDRSCEVEIDSYEPVYFNVSVSILVNARYLFEAVRGAVEAALKEAFSFDARALGQAVSAAEIIAVIHQVEGVDAADLDALYVSTDPTQPNKAVLFAEAARWDGTDSILPAQLLRINEIGMTLTEMAS
jgi:hypothetical protein